MTAQPWKRIEPTELSKVGWRTIVSKTFAMPDDRTMQWQTIDPERGSCTSTIAVTKDNRFLVVRQFRPGPEVFLDEVVGGFAFDEMPEENARNELLEETGYAAEKIELIGEFYQNPYFNTRIYCFWASGCHHKVQEPTPEPTEFIEIREVSAREFLELALSQFFPDKAAVLYAYERIKHIIDNEEDRS